MPPLPIRRNAHVAQPELFTRWNAMHADTTAKNLEGQQKLHAAVCETSKDCVTGRPIGNIHHTPDFVLWHRAFLFFHEQILSAFGGSNVGLPYWEWTSDRVCPPAFQSTGSNQFTFKSHLKHSPHGLGDENFTPENIAAVVAALRMLPPAEAAMDLFSEPIHTLVHGKFGWDHQTDLTTAARDPAFYGHHGNLDRLATHIFEKGWPAPSGISYHFVGPDGETVCTTLDRFAIMPSPYEGDGPIDTSRFRITNLEPRPKAQTQPYLRIRTKLRFPSPLKMGVYELVTAKGKAIGEIAALHHEGTTDFIVWLSAEDYSLALQDGITTTLDHGIAKITAAAQVSRDA